MPARSRSGAEYREPSYVVALTYSGIRKCWGRHSPIHGASPPTSCRFCATAALLVPETCERSELVVEFAQVLKKPWANCKRRCAQKKSLLINKPYDLAMRLRC